MNVTYWVGLLGALGMLGFVIELLRRGILRERFAALWLIVGVAIVVLAAVPSVLEVAATAVGIEVPSNLLFVAGGFLLLVVSVQLSYEVSLQDARTRRLAEEVALLRYDLDRMHPERGGADDD